MIASMDSNFAEYSSKMIDPQNITNFRRTLNQLQEFLLFAIVVAGKTAQIQAGKLEEFLLAVRNHFVANKHRVPSNHFEALQFLGLKGIEKWLRWAKLGQYTRISQAFLDLANSELNLEICSVEELEQIKGIGPKTARFFKLHTDLLAKCAALDTHVLKFLRGAGVENVPDTTPSNRKEYLRLEQEFLKLFYKQNLYESLADYDLAVWRRFSA